MTSKQTNNVLLTNQTDNVTTKIKLK